MKTIYKISLTVAIMIGLSACDGASTENPTISLDGATDIKIALGDYSIPEGGYHASDTKDGDLTAYVTRNHNIDFTKPGQYQITYSV